MSTYEPEQLLQLWKQNQIDAEMAIGHLLQHLVAQQQAMKKMNSALIRLQLDLDQLIKQVKAIPASPNETKPGT